MTSELEKRFHHRILVNWPVILVSPQGSIEGEIRNISVRGAFILYSERPELSDDFQIVLKPSEELSISIAAKKVWSGSFNINGKTVFSGMGVRFIELSSDDRGFISSLVAKHRNNGGTRSGR